DHDRDAPRGAARRVAALRVRDVARRGRGARRRLHAPRVRRRQARRAAVHAGDARGARLGGDRSARGHAPGVALGRARGARAGYHALMLHGLARLVLLASLVACGHSGSARLEGRWKGARADGVTPDVQTAANAFATDTEIDVKGDAITVSTPHDKQSG